MKKAFGKAFIFIFLTASLLIGTGVIQTFAATTNNCTIDMYIFGQKSGELKGPGAQKGREEAIQVLAISNLIFTPLDPQSGVPTGKRIYKPFVITKEVDKTSPILMNMLCTNENIKQVVLRFYMPKPTLDHTIVNAYTIKLINANIASVKLNEDLNSSGLVTEEVSFTFQKIEWTWNDGGISAEDSL